MGILGDVAAATRPVIRAAPLSGVDTVTVANAAANRYAIGFTCNDGAKTVVGINPLFGGGDEIVISSLQITWFNTRDHGAFPQVEWYGYPSGFTPLVVVLELFFTRE